MDRQWSISEVALHKACSDWAGGALSVRPEVGLVRSALLPCKVSYSCLRVCMSSMLAFVKAISAISARGSICWTGEVSPVDRNT